METHSQTGIPRKQARIRWGVILLNILCGVVLAALVTLTTLTALESIRDKFLRLGFTQVPGVPWGLLVVAAAIVVLYTLHPLPGSILALMAVFPALALYHFGLAVLYAACAMLALPCLYKRGGVFLFVLAGLVAKNPALALLLPCLPVIGGLMYGRGAGWYAAAVLVVVTLVAGLAAGQTMVGFIRIGENKPSLMESEGMVIVKGVFLPLDFPLVFGPEKPWHNLGAILLLSLVSGWTTIWLLGAYGILALELWPRLVPLLPLVLLSAVVGEIVAWTMWVLRRIAGRCA